MRLLACCLGEGPFALREIARAVEAGGGFLDIKGVAVPALEGTRFSTLRRNTDLK